MESGDKRPTKEGSENIEGFIASPEMEIEGAAGEERYRKSPNESNPEIEVVATHYIVNVNRARDGVDYADR